MPMFTYKVRVGVFVTTDLEPPTWVEKFAVDPAQEALIRAGANLETLEDGALVITPISGNSIELEPEPEPAPEPEDPPPDPETPEPEA